MNFGDPRLPAHFWDSCFPEPNSGCWIATSRTVPGGYTQIQIGGARIVAHRVAWLAAGGELPADPEADVELDHRCRTPACRNPAHLRLVTHRENMLVYGVTAFSAVNAAKTHCIRGHELAAHGQFRMRRDGTTYRVCMTCERERNAIRFAPGKQRGRTRRVEARGSTETRRL